MILYCGNMLSKHGYSPSFIELFSPKLQEKYEVISVSDKKNILLRLLHMSYTLFHNRKNVDLVLIDSYSSKAFLYTYVMAVICQWLNIPYIPILHGGAFQQRLSKSSKMSQKVFKYSYTNVSPSLFLKEVFETAGYDVTYIPNFIPIENYHFKKRMTIKPQLLWVRAFHKIYNPKMAIKVLDELTKKYDDVQLCMVGTDKDGTFNEVKKMVEELGLEKQVTFTGFLPQKEWLKLSEKYDVFINTTNFDNHPISVIEAMALGLPIVSTNAGGVPFLIDHLNDGLLVDLDNTKSMVLNIMHLIEDKVLVEKLTHNARRKVEEFAWNNIKYKWFEVIDEVI